MAARRSEDREESNASQITLKFWLRLGKLGLGVKLGLPFCMLLFYEQLSADMFNSKFNILMSCIWVNFREGKKVITKKVRVGFGFLWTEWDSIWRNNAHLSISDLCVY
jgi:hypothetical protein